MFILIDMAPAS